MLQVNVALPNGDAELLSLLPSSTVQDLRTAAQRAFGRKCLRLITAKSRVLVDPNKTLEAAEIEDGECLTALLLQPQLAATKTAFALWCHGDSAVVTWGSARSGGDSSAVRDQLRGVQQIQATWGPLLPPPAPRRARRPPGPVLTKVQGAKGRKTYRAFSGLLHQDVLGALGLCADNSTGCELEKHVRRLVGSLPWGFALSILQTKWSCVSKIDSSTSLQGSCLAHCCSVSLLSWSPKLASSRLAFRLSNTGFAKSIHIYNAVLCGLAP